MRGLVEGKFKRWLLVAGRHGMAWHGTAHCAVTTVSLCMRKDVMILLFDELTHLRYPIRFDSSAVVGDILTLLYLAVIGVSTI